MSRSQSMGNIPVGPSSSGRALHSSSPGTIARYLSDKPLPKPAVSPQHRHFAHSPTESSMLSPPLSAIGNPRKRPDTGRPVVAHRHSGSVTARNSTQSASPESSDLLDPQQRNNSVSRQKRQSSLASEKEDRRLTFGRSMVSPVTSTSPRLSSTSAISPRLSMQHPPTPPPDIPLPPVPVREPAVSPEVARRFSQLPMPSRIHSSTSRSGRPGLQSRHSAASRLPTRALRHQKSSPELGSAAWSRTSTRPRTPWAIAPGPTSPELIQFAKMESLSPMLLDEPLSPILGMPLSPTFEAIGAMLEEPTTGSSLIIDTEPPWMEGTDPLDQGLPTFAEPLPHSAVSSPTFASSTSTWTAPHAQYAISAPSMKKATSTGLEGIKLLLAQVDDWTRVHGCGNPALEDPFNARAETTMHRGMMADSEEYVVWGTAL